MVRPKILVVPTEARLNTIWLQNHSPEINNGSFYMPCQYNLEIREKNTAFVKKINLLKKTKNIQSKEIKLSVIMYVTI